MTKHTPGPWEAELPLGHRRWHIGPDGNAVAIVEREADARLIAAAPELLEALERLLPWYEKMLGLHAMDARAAIAKAIGKQEAAQAESPGRSGEEG